MVPLGVALAISLAIRDVSQAQAVETLTAAIVNIVPEGLILLVSLTAAVSAAKMARRGVLAQQLNAIESLASVSVLCTDKTGTLTEASLRVVELVPAGDVDRDDARPVARRVRRQLAVAQRDARGGPRGGAGGRRRRRGAVGAGAVLLAAALERPGARRRAADPRRARGAARRRRRRPAARPRPTEEAATGRRVLALAAAGAPLPPAAPDAPLPQPLRPLGVVVLAERLRANAGETVAFFAAEEVGLKVVSGDSPATVGAIARDAGIPAESAALDGGALPDGDEALLDAVRAAPAIGRISPEDKARVVRVLAESGDYVGMLGDGVNDVPALKQARLAIAQGSGTQMARAVADLVLVSGEFGEVPRMVHEGRQILRNIQRVARLFVTKALFTAFLLVTIALPTGVFPLLPRQFTLTSSLTIGIPAFFLALAPSHRALATGGLPQGDRPLLAPGGSRDRHRDPHRVPRRPPRVRHLAHRGADGDRGDGRHRGPRRRHGARGRAGPPAPAGRRALRAHGARLRDRRRPSRSGASSSTSRRRRARWSPSWAIGAAVTIVLLVIALRAVRVLDARAEQSA